MTTPSPAPGSQPVTIDRRTHTVLESTSCGARLVGVRGCPERNSFMHALRIGGVCNPLRRATTRG